MSATELYRETSRRETSRVSGETFDCFRRVMERELLSLQDACERISQQQDNVERACRILKSGATDQSAKRVIVSGVGKAGLIARKVAATLCSTGTPAVFLHPVDGLHGDVGFVNPKDSVLLFSYSGETGELIKFATQLCQLGCEIVSLTRSESSSLARLSNICLVTGDLEEACYLGLAPTSSTTVMLAIGDALALAIAQQNGFREEDFARNHPAGSLGLKFRSVSGVMRTGERLVCVSPHAFVRQVLQVVSDAKTGAAILADDDGALTGIFTDGDLRRALLQGANVLDHPVNRFATQPCRFIDAGASLAEALNLFSATRIEDLPVVDRNSGKVVGLLCLKDIK